MLTQERLALLRSQVQHLFQRDWYATAVEILIFVSTMFLWGVFSLPRTIVPFVLFAWLSLWLRGSSWHEVGLHKPENSLLTMLVGTGVAAGTALAGSFVLSPLLTLLTGEGPETTAYQFLRNNWAVWLGLLVLIWPLAAVMEEMVYRGYFLTRVADLFGRTQGGWIIGLLTSSLLFTLSHGQYTVRFLATSLIMGLLEGSMYLVWKRNLWMPIIIHGVADTITFTLLFLGAM